MAGLRGGSAGFGAATVLDRFAFFLPFFLGVQGEGLLRLAETGSRMCIAPMPRAWPPSS